MLLDEVCFNDKGNGGIGGGIASEDWERFMNTNTQAPMGLRNLWQAPLPGRQRSHLDALAQELKTLAHPVNFGDKQVSHAKLDSIRHHVAASDVE